MGRLPAHTNDCCPAPVTFGLLHMAALWPAFMARNPKLTLDVTLADRFVDFLVESFVQHGWCT